MNIQRKKSEITALQIQKAILDGWYKPGDRLPPERSLADEYGVSRAILREAVKHLSGIGLVRTEPQSGTYVTDYGQEASLEFLVYLLENNETLNPEIFLSLLDFRELLETGAASRAALKSDEDFILSLNDNLKLMRAAAGDVELLTSRDYDFHRMIIGKTGNIAFKLLFNACRSVYTFYAQEFYSYPEHIEQTFKQLENLIEALKRKDPIASAEIMRYALSYGRDSIYDSLNIIADHKIKE
jgi:GntR family transcriptional repressor for pyruvate dehydrogenase complex